MRAFVDRDVKPGVREVEHANTYPDAWIDQMERIGMPTCRRWPPASCGPPWR